MTILHKGIRRNLSDLANDYGAAQYAKNWTYKRVGEIGRRPGLGKSDMASLGGPVTLMAFGNFYEPYIVQITTTGSVVTTKGALIVGGGGGPLFPPPPPNACSRFAAKTDTGSLSDSVTFTLPPNACASVLSLTAIEAPVRRGAAYGYAFVVDGDGVNIAGTGCIFDDSQNVNIPQGIQTVRIGITGGCNGGTDPGTWQVDLVQ